MELGWLQSANEYHATDLRILPLPDFDESRAFVLTSGHICKGWFYPPIQQLQDEGVKDIIPVPHFALPPTHVLEVPHGKSQEFKEFIITIFGWAMGLKLQPAHWGHFYRVAIEPGKLTDFEYSSNHVTTILNLAQKYWKDHKGSPAIASLLSAIHWYLFSQSYTHYFERFLMQYTVTDAIANIFKILGKIEERTGNYKLPTELSNMLKVQLPPWGIISDKKTTLSEIRNEMIHEAKFYGHPIGFTAPPPSDNIPLVEMEAFNCRLIAATIGAHGKYTKSPCNTRQRYELATGINDPNG